MRCIVVLAILMQAVALTADPLRDAKAALERNDRAAFDAALAQMSNPPRIWQDIALVWDAQFESPYFAAGSPAHAAASTYPGYEAAVRREVIVDERGETFYPAAETRAFLARIAGARVGEAGVIEEAPRTRRVPTKVRTDRTRLKKR